MKTLKDFFNSIKGGEFLEEINNNIAKPYYSGHITRSDVYYSASKLLEKRLYNFIEDEDKYFGNYEVVSNTF